ncbi:hypothetical protein AB1Y20_003043 [Prymnesium parvum]|uniref:Zeta toxin domain-containing protein n=1 Tax=Prymnesium parvum TaxID=97485 RepID=A0AB34JAC1_PRYPA
MWLLCLLAHDAKMLPTYDRLAARLTERMARAPADRPLWIGIAGGPGAGKSTLAAAVSARVNEARGTDASVVLPMDGFHYSRAQLRQLDPPDASSYLPRRGAPWTFDAEGLCAALSSAKRLGHASLPVRELSDPVPDGVRLLPTHRCVLVEGNYLLMFDDPRWAPLAELWDEKWFVACTDAAEQRRRLIQRHLETWNDEKALRWGPGEAGAAARADANDVKNMQMIASSSKYADLVIESK